MILTRLIAVGCLTMFTLSCAGPVSAQEPAGDAPPPATQPGQTRKLPHMVVDVANREIRVDCISLAIDAPLEFLCVTANGPTHESVLASHVKPSDLHLAMLMLGLEPGQPVRYSEAAQRWFPPEGPRIHIDVEFERDGKTVRMPASRLMRHLETKREMPATTWIFCGSRIMDDGNYAADVTGYIVSVVNFDLTVIDVPDLRSNANETLEWETNLELCPPEGTAVTMIIRPAGAAPATQPAQAAGAAEGPAPIDVVLIEVDADGNAMIARQPVPIPQITERLTRLKQDRPVSVRISATPQTPYEHVVAVLSAATAAGVDVSIAAEQRDVAVSASPAAVPPGPRADDARMAALRQHWEQVIRPNREVLRQAAQAHYDAIQELRAEQQRLIDEADRIQRLIDQLEREYQDITTPRAGN